MFLTARVGGLVNLTHDAPLLMLTADAAGLAYLREQIAPFPRPLLLVPVTGSARVLNGAHQAEMFAQGADGTQDRLIEVFEGVRAYGQPFITPHTMPGRGVWTSFRIPEGWQLDDDLLRSVILFATVVQRGDTRPMTAVDAQGRMYSADDLAALALAQDLYLSTYDIQSLSDFATGLGFTIETLATLPILSPIVGEDPDTGEPIYGDVWKALHAFIKCYAVGLGCPRITSIVDTTAGMLAHPITRALVAASVQAMLAIGWPLEKLQRSQLTRRFVQHL